MKYVGKIELNRKIDITDPCYKKGTWCRLTTECEPGEYHGYVNMSNKGDWGIRVASLSIFKDRKKVPLKKMECIGTIGVDAGLAGFFNDKPDFSNEEWTELCHAIETGDAWNMYNGIFSSSGFGDGLYQVFANPERNAFTIKFL